MTDSQAINSSVLEPQAISASYLADCEEMLEQLSASLRKKAQDYILDKPVDFYRWERMHDMTNKLRAAICTVKEEEQEAEHQSERLTKSTIG